MRFSSTLIFTDLDGTLLNHFDYSYADALPLIEQLKKAHIPIIIVTSKTRSEVARLRAELGIEDPFIVENGAGIFIPPGASLAGAGEPCDGYRRISLAKRYDEVIAFYREVKEQYGLIGFSDMSVADVCRHTGLDEEGAARAKERDFTEPMIVKDEAVLPALIREAALSGLAVVKGGRFYHLITRGQDKGHAVRRLCTLYAETESSTPYSIALGDSANDFPMLEAVDQPILIPHPDGNFAPLSLPKLIKAPYPGSKGWRHALEGVLHGP